MPEAEWTPQEQGWMLALAQYEQLRCETCGGDLRETTKHEDWEADPPLQCHRCEVIAVSQDSYVKDYPHIHTMRWSARRRGR